MLVVSIGQAFALIVGGFDISVGSTMGLVSIAVALLMKTGMDVPIAALLATLVGTMVGLVNGVGIALFRITPFVMTLGVLSAARGLADELANGRVITGFPQCLCDVWPSDVGAHSERDLHRARCARHLMGRSSTHSGRPVDFRHWRQPRDHARRRHSSRSL